MTTGWSKEQMEEMFGDDIIGQLAFLAGCTKHSYADPKNLELNGYIINDEKLEKFAKLIVREVFSKIGDERFEVYQPVKESVMKHFGIKDE